MKLHFSVFTLILFAEIQLKIFESSLLKIVDIEGVASFLNLQESVLSSANKVNLKKLEQFGKSLIKIRKSSGPRIEPWGTPQSTKRRSDKLFFKFYVLLPVRNVRPKPVQSNATNSIHSQFI